MRIRRAEPVRGVGIATGSRRTPGRAVRPFRIRAAGAWGAVACGLLVLMVAGCYNPQRGSPVDRLHYEHVILVRDDFSHARVRTYINRTHLLVGLQTEDLYDGDRDGQLTTVGLDRVAIADYANVEDPPEAASRREGELADYDTLFREIIAAARSGAAAFRIESRDYRMQMYSEDLNAAERSPRLG